MSGGGGSSHPVAVIVAAPNPQHRQDACESAPLRSGRPRRRRGHPHEVGPPKVLHELGGRPCSATYSPPPRRSTPQRLVVVVGHGRDAVKRTSTSPTPTPGRGAGAPARHGPRGAPRARRGRRTLDGPSSSLAGDAPLITSATLLEAARRPRARPAPRRRSCRRGSTTPPATAGSSVAAGRGARDRRAEATPTPSSARSARSTRGLRVRARTAARRPAPDRHRQRRRRGVPHRRPGAAARRRPAASARWPRPAPTRSLGVNDRVQLAAGPGAAARPDRGALDARGRDRRRPAVRPGSASTSRSRPTASCTRTPSCTGAPTWHGWRRWPRHHAARRRRRGGRPACGARTATEARIGPGAQVGPFSFLRPGTVLAAGAKVGAYVETKNARRRRGLEGAPPVLRRRRDDRRGSQHRCRHGLRQLRRRGQAPHRRRRPCPGGQRLDARRPARRSGTAPTPAAGSVITDDVPPGAMAVGRARQRNVEGWVGAQACRVRGRPRRSAALAARVRHRPGCRHRRPRGAPRVTGIKMTPRSA